MKLRLHLTAAGKHPKAGSTSGLPEKPLVGGK